MSWVLTGLQALAQPSRNIVVLHKAKTPKDLLGQQALAQPKNNLNATKHSLKQTPLIALLDQTPPITCTILNKTNQQLQYS